MDTPQISVISLPANQHTILLDHLKKEAMVIPMIAAPGSTTAHAGGIPQGSAPPAPPVKVEDLGKSMIEGHEVEGKRYTLPPPPPLPKIKMPEMPKLPNLPQIPKMPQAAMPKPPKPPQPPKPPEVPKPPQPTVTEVWTSTKLKTPVLTKITSSAGERTTYCKPTSEAEPHPSIFQIPPEYKLKTK